MDTRTDEFLVDEAVKEKRGTIVRVANAFCRRSRATIRLVALLGTLTVASVGLSVTVLAQPSAAVGNTLVISTSGHDVGNCQTVACATLGYALSQATAGDTILVDPGTYLVSANPSGEVTVPAALSDLTIEPNSSAGGDAANTIFDATGAIYGLQVNADNVTVNDLTFENSGAAGIFVTPPSSATPPATVSGGTIEGDVVNNSDQCSLDPSAAGCAAAIGAGDYGESVWLVSVTTSTIEGTTIENGLTGGLLVSDEMGPNHGNTIKDNMVVNNARGCGITLAAHNQSAFPAPDPSAGGVYDNVVEDNTSSNNGATGIGLFNAAFDNTLEGNTFDGNGEPGVVLNPTFPGGDVNGNIITGNTIGVNGLHDGPGGAPGSHNALSTQTIGVVVVGAGPPVTGTVISNNTISGNFFGVYLAALASSAAVSGNTISVTTNGVPVFLAPAPGAGYWLVGADGGVFTFGVRFAGSTGSLKLNAPIVGMAATPDRAGYWLVAKDGGVFAFGSATFYGSEGGTKLNAPIVGMAATPDGGGYWLVAADGGVFSFGDATFYGSEGGTKLNAPVVGMATTPDGGGYWLVAADGGVFSFGDAKFHGSEGGTKLNAPMVGMASTPDGGGYWLVAADGGVFSLGDAKFHGSEGGTKLNAPMVGMAATPDGGGYWLVAADGGVFSLGDANFHGSEGGTRLNAPMVGMASS